MNLEDFRALLNETDPPWQCSPLLKALWFDARGDWDRAHQIAQQEGGADGAWVHAFLHREEGDLGNASFWYSRAGRERPDTSLDEEWNTIVQKLLEKEQA